MSETYGPWEISRWCVGCKGELTEKQYHASALCHHCGKTSWLLPDVIEKRRRKVYKTGDRREAILATAAKKAGIFSLAKLRYALYKREPRKFEWEYKT